MEITPDVRRNFRKAFWIAAGYTPTTGDFPIYNLEEEHVITSHGQAEIHEDTHRIKQITGGVRAGKSKATAMDCPEDLLVENGLMWIVGPDYEQGKAEFGYIHDALDRLGFIDGKPSMPERGSQQLTTTWGYKVQTKSGADLQALASYPLDKILIVEANQQSSGIRIKAAERTVETNGKIILSGTLENSQPWYADCWKRWQGDNPEGARSFSLPTWSNTAVFPGGRYDPKIVEMEALINDPAVFLERCAAIPTKPSQLVFGEYEARRHAKPLEFNPKLPVELGIDPAKHTYAIEVIQYETLPVYKWFEKWEVEPPKLAASVLQQERTIVSVVDEIYKHNIIAQDIIPLLKAKPYYPYIKKGIIDNAGKQQQGNKSQIQIWHEETGLMLRGNYVKIDQHIAVLKLRLRNDLALGRPLIQFNYRMDSSKTEQGKANGILAEFGLYKWPAFSESHNERSVPIDNNNDACKAISYWLYAQFGPVIERKSAPKLVKIRRAF